MLPRLLLLGAIVLLIGAAANLLYHYGIASGSFIQRALL
jgi:hypothetical protein